MRGPVQDFIVWLALLALISAFCVGIAALHAHLVYDDWTCAFARCVKVRP